MKYKSSIPWTTFLINQNVTIKALETSIWTYVDRVVHETLDTWRSNITQHSLPGKCKDSSSVKLRKEKRHAPNGATTGRHLWIFLVKRTATQIANSSNQHRFNTNPTLPRRIDILSSTRESLTFAVKISKANEDVYASNLRHPTHIEWSNAPDESRQ